jgi:hypothetical protein
MTQNIQQRERFFDTLNRGFFVGLPIVAVTGLTYALYLSVVLLLDAVGLANFWVGAVVIASGTTLWLYAIGHVAAPRDYEIARRAGFHSLRDLQKMFSEQTPPGANSAFKN